MKPKLNTFFLLIMLLLCKIILAQSQVFSSQILPFDQEEKLFLIASGDTLVSIGEKKRVHFIQSNTELIPLFTQNAASNEVNDLVSFQDFTPISFEDKTLFVQNGLGKVYQWNNHRFQRLDNSFYLRNHFGSCIFEHEGILYSYGGYGFWNFHDFIVQFSEKMKEWNVHIHTSKTIPPGRKSPFFHKTKNEFIAFGGEGSKDFLKDIFAFDFKQNRFVHKGNIHSKFPYQTASIYHAHQNNVHYYLMPDFKWLRLDYDNYTFQLTDEVSGLKEQSLSSNLLIHQNQIHFITYKTGIHRLNTITLDKLDALFAPPKNLIELNQFSYMGYIATAVLGLLLLRCLFIIFRWRNIKTTTPLLQGRYLTFKKSILILSEEEKSILEFLMESDEASSHELSQLKCYAEYSQSYRLITTLNDLKTLTEKIERSKAFRKIIHIQKTTNSKDRRQKKYTLEGRVIAYHGWVSHFFNYTHSFAS